MLGPPPKLLSRSCIARGPAFPASRTPFQAFALSGGINRPLPSVDPPYGIPRKNNTLVAATPRIFPYSVVAIGPSAADVNARASGPPPNALIAPCPAKPASRLRRLIDPSFTSRMIFPSLNSHLGTIWLLKLILESVVTLGDWLFSCQGFISAICVLSRRWRSFTNTFVEWVISIDRRIIMASSRWWRSESWKSIVQ